MFDDVPGAASAAVLAGVVPADLDDADLVDAMRGWERLASWVAAGQLATIAELARRRPRDWVERGPGRIDRGDPRVPEITEFAVDEVAAALRLTGLAAGVRLQLAVELAGRLPGTAAALRAGRLDVPRARVIADGVAALEDRLATAVEERVLARAGDQTTGQLRVTLARVVLAADPSAAEARHERAVAERQVTVRPLPDGMAGLWALLPADGATALYARLDHVARGGPAGDPRPMDARRADALLALALGAVAPGAGVPTTSVPTTAASAAPTAAHSVPTTAATSAPVLVGASVRVTVRAETALGLADEPGHVAATGRCRLGWPVGSRVMATGAECSPTRSPASWSISAAPPTRRPRHSPTSSAPATPPGASPAAGSRPTGATSTTSCHGRRVPQPQPTWPPSAGTTTASNTRAGGPCAPDPPAT